MLGLLGVLVAGLLVVAWLQVRAAQAQTDAENRRTASFLIADSLRQSSNDLTNSADHAQTMYGYAAKGELYKRDVANGDKKGVTTAYGP